MTSRRGLELAVECLMYDAVTAVLAATLGLLAVAIALVQLLGQELEELMGVLLLVRDEGLKGLVLGNPEARQDVGCRITVGRIAAPEVLKHVVHSAAQTVLNLAGGPGVTIAKVKVLEYGIVDKGLQDDVLVTGGACVVDAS